METTRRRLASISGSLASWPRRTSRWSARRSARDVVAGDLVLGQSLAASVPARIRSASSTSSAASSSLTLPISFRYMCTGSAAEPRKLSASGSRSPPTSRTARDALGRRPCRRRRDRRHGPGGGTATSLGLPLGRRRTGHGHDGGLAGVVGELDAGLADPLDDPGDQVGAELDRPQDRHHVVLGQAALARPSAAAPRTRRPPGVLGGQASAADGRRHGAGPVSDRRRRARLRLASPAPYSETTCLVVMRPARIRPAVPSPRARLPTGASPPPSEPDRPAPGPMTATSAASATARATSGPRR